MQLPGSAHIRRTKAGWISSLLAQIKTARTGNNTALLDTQELVSLQQLADEQTWSPELLREVANPLSGDIRSVFLGVGMDYEESRPYQPGDDLRFMNWRLSARTGQHYMKVFREEKRPATFILLDERPEMRFGSRKRLKATQAIRLAAYIAFSAIHRHCGVAGLVLADEVKWFDACHDDAGVYHMLNYAAGPCLPAYKTARQDIPLDHYIKLVQKMMKPGSDICLVSDFHDLSESSRAALLQLSLECNVTAVLVYDEAEYRLPNTGKFILHSANPEEDCLALNSDSDSTKQYFEKLAKDDIDRRRLYFKSLGINCITVRADSDDLALDMLTP